MRKKLLVTGGSGLVGSSIQADVKTKSSDYDLRIPGESDRMFFEHSPTHVIHCAAKVGGILGNMTYKGEYFYDNIMINTNVIESSRKYGVEKLVAFLSTCVFPDGIEYPLTENKIHLGEPHSSNYPYAYSKRMAEVQIRAYREQYGLDYKSVIPTNIYGENDNFSLESGHVIPMLIHRMYNCILNGEDFIVWGSGNPLREFIYSKDVALLSEWVLNYYTENEPIILSTSEEVRIGDVVSIIADEFNFGGKIVFDKTKPDGQFRKPSDNSKIKHYLPDFEFTPLEIGLRNTIKWFIENYKNVRK